MKSFVLLAFVALVGFVAAETYSDRYDDLNIDEILANKKLLYPYIKCALDEGKCTAEGKYLKDNMRDGIQTACEKCTQKQRVNSRKIVNYLKENEKEYYDQLLAKYDPGNKYKPVYEKFLNSDD